MVGSISSEVLLPTRSQRSAALVSDRSLWEGSREVDAEAGKGCKHDWMCSGRGQDRTPENAKKRCAQKWQVLISRRHKLFLDLTYLERTFIQNFLHSY